MHQASGRHRGGASDPFPGPRHPECRRPPLHPSGSIFSMRHLRLIHLSVLQFFAASKSAALLIGGKGILP